MTQQSLYSAVPPKRSTAPSSSQTIRMVLASHAIESELRIGLPRSVAPTRSILSNDLLLATVLLLLAPLGYLIRLDRSIGLFFGIVPLLVAFFLVGRFFSSLPQWKQKRMLEGGIPKPAVVYQVEPTADGKAFRVTYVRESSTSARTFDSLTLTKEQVEAYELHRWKSFTLLVNRDDEHDVLPYFLVDAYKVAGTTRTLPVVARAPKPLPQVRRQPVITNAPIAAEIGVEPELFCAAPRRVVWTRSTIRARLWLLNFIGGTCAAAYYFIQSGADDYDTVTTKVMLFIVILLVAIAWLIWEANLRAKQLILRDGVAVRATVITCRKSEYEGSVYTHVRFTYPRNKNESGHGDLSLWQGEVDRLGGIEVGSTFTVLRHPTESFTILPYYQLSNVEIPGAGVAKTTPPPSSIP